MSSPRYGYVQLTQRQRDAFWSKVSVSDGCWLWTASVAHGGYGQVSAPVGGKWVCISASRVAYMLTYGPIGDGLHVMHTCDVPRCCNPAHLTLGTHADNMRDASAKNRRSMPLHKLRKLTDVEAADVRRRRAAGETFTAIGRRYGVSPGAVWHITSGRTYKARYGVLAHAV